MSKFIISGSPVIWMYFRLVISWQQAGNERKNKHFSDLKRLRVPEIDSLLQNTIRDTRIKNVSFFVIFPAFNTRVFYGIFLKWPCRFLSDPGYVCTDTNLLQWQNGSIIIMQIIEMPIRKVEWPGFFSNGKIRPLFISSVRFVECLWEILLFEFMVFFISRLIYFPLLFLSFLQRIKVEFWT